MTLRVENYPAAVKRPAEVKRPASAISTVTASSWASPAAPYPKEVKDKIPCQEWQDTRRLPLEDSVDDHAAVKSPAMAEGKPSPVKNGRTTSTPAIHHSGTVLTATVSVTYPTGETLNVSTSSWASPATARPKVKDKPSPFKNGRTTSTPAIHHSGTVMTTTASVKRPAGAALNVSASSWDSSAAAPRTTNGSTLNKALVRPLLTVNPVTAASTARSYRSRVLTGSSANKATVIPVKAAAATEGRKLVNSDASFPAVKAVDHSVVAMDDKLKANHGQLQQQLLDEKATVAKLVNDVSRLTEELAVQECLEEVMKRAQAENWRLQKLSGDIAALHVIHKYIHNSSTEFQDQLCQDQLVAADTSVVDNMKAQVSELEEKLAIAEEATTAAEQMEFAKEAIT
ncbi:hypothetical protein V8E54_013658, partial [Elaphomyces granulatus]